MDLQSTYLKYTSLLNKSNYQCGVPRVDGNEKDWMWKNERRRDSLLQRRPKCKYANTALHYFELRVNVSCDKCTIVSNQCSIIVVV